MIDLLGPLPDARHTAAIDAGCGDTDPGVILATPSGPLIGRVSRGEPDIEDVE